MLLLQRNIFKDEQKKNFYCNKHTTKICQYYNEDVSHSFCITIDLVFNNLWLHLVTNKKQNVKKNIKFSFSCLLFKLRKFFLLVFFKVLKCAISSMTERILTSHFFFANIMLKGSKEITYNIRYLNCHQPTTMKQLKVVSVSGKRFFVSWKFEYFNQMTSLEKTKWLRRLRIFLKFVVKSCSFTSTRQALKQINLAVNSFGK